MKKIRKDSEHLIARSTVRQRAAGIGSRKGEGKKVGLGITKEHGLTLNLIKGLKDGIALVDGEGRQILVNDELCKMTGFSEEELLGQRAPFKYWAEEGLKEINDAFEKTLKGAAGEYELIFKRKNGERFTALVSPGKTVDADGNDYFFATVKDITERRQMEVGLKESAARQRSVLQSARDAIISVDGSGSIILWNRGAQVIFGYTEEEAIGKSIAFLMPEQFRDAFQKGMKYAGLQDQPAFAGKLYELLGLRKDGSEFPAEVALSSWKTEQGVFHTSVVRDITDRKQEELEAVRQHDLLEAINRVFREAIMCENEEQLSQTCLAVAEELTGSKFGFLGELNQDGLFDTIAVSNPGWDVCKILDSEATRLTKNMEIRGIDRSLLREGKSRIVNKPSSHPDRVGIPEGHPPITSFLGVPLVDAGKTFGMIGLANKESGAEPADQEAVEHLAVAIVEALKRKQAEEALRESEERYRCLIELGGQVGEAVVMMQDSEQGEGIQTFVSDEWPRITGYSKEELLGMSFFDLVSPEYREAAMERHRQKMTGEDVPDLFEMVIIRKDGSEFPVELTSAYTTYKGKRANVAFVREIEERKKNEEQIIRTQRLAAVGELVSGVAHEINNPLTGIIGFAELVLERDVPDNIKEDIAIIHHEAKRAAGVIENLLTFARKHKPEKQLINVNSIIARVIRLRAYKHKVNNIQVTTHFATNLPAVMADASQLQQIFLNIIINAEHAMADMGGENLVINTEQMGDMVRVAFTDDGLGISPENMSHIFDPFFTTKELGKGTGLGLSVCHGMVVEHGGRIYAESELGEGATFVVELPVVTIDVGGGMDDG
jgi:PAS domain S-box-containing protein